MDFARCRGVGNNKDGWREGCENCARRLAPASGDAPNMEPPFIIVFWCEYHIPYEGVIGCEIHSDSDE